MPLREPVVQRAPLGEAGGPAPAQPAELSMPLARPPALRPPSIPAIATGEIEPGGIVQRVTTEEPTAGQKPGGGSAQETPGPNLDQLARQIYPIIKHMLAIERERRYGHPL